MSQSQIPRHTASSIAARLVAHRGDRSRFAENSLSGFSALLAAGAKIIETDLQMTADAVPVLCHDVGLQRLCGVESNVHETKLAELQALPFTSSKAERGEGIATLVSLVELLKQHADSYAFIEIKADVRQHCGEPGLDRILAELSGLENRVCLISFSQKTLMYLKAKGDFPMGYVLPDWNETVRVKAVQLMPDYLICNYQRLPANVKNLWPGSWRWMAYSANEIHVVKDLAERGMDLIETDCYLDLRDALLQGSGDD